MREKEIINLIDNGYFISAKNHWSIATVHDWTAIENIDVADIFTLSAVKSLIAMARIRFTIYVWSWVLQPVRLKYVISKI